MATASEVDVNCITETAARLTPGGFAWTLHCHDTETKKPLVITLRFEWLWMRKLAHDLRGIILERKRECDDALDLLRPH